MIRDFSAARNPTGNTVPSTIGTSPKSSPGPRSPTTRPIPSTSLTASMRPSSTAKSARSPPSCAAYSPGMRATSAAARESRSRSAPPRPAKIPMAPISSVVTMTRTPAAAWSTPSCGRPHAGPGRPERSRVHREIARDDATPSHPAAHSLLRSLLHDRRSARPDRFEPVLADGLRLEREQARPEVEQRPDRKADDVEVVALDALDERPAAALDRVAARALLPLPAGDVPVEH